jgi:NhaP-type Na+/H+ or K+/H+ antiporter
MSVVFSAIVLGLAVSFSLVYVNIFKEYASKKKTESNYWKIIDFTWRVSLPILFGFICLIVPLNLMCYFVDDESTIDALSSIYLYSFIGCFFISLFVLIKLGKIKNNKILQ